MKKDQGTRLTRRPHRFSPETVNEQYDYGAFYRLSVQKPLRDIYETCLLEYQRD